MTERDDDVRREDADAQALAAKIAALNDQLRRFPISGRLAVTAGVIGLGEGLLAAILQQVAAYDAFDDGNDPHGEHDFGAFEQGGARLFWKIDYYDQAMEYGSPDPADPAVTTRILTVMLAEEY